jgi:dTDP-4-dehydrorhamnose 3,5-epimerase-like enzyme
MTFNETSLAGAFVVGPERIEDQRGYFARTWCRDEFAAHGFQTPEDASEVFYQMSDFYHPESARGLRWGDPAVGIALPPSGSRIISERGLSLPGLGVSK